MTTLPPLTLTIAVGLAALAAGLMLPLEPRPGGRWAIAARLAVLAPLVPLAGYAEVSPVRIAVAVALVVALLARPSRDAFHTECALKVLWVTGIALALSVAGHTLFTILSGTPRPPEQWSVLGLEIDARTLWRTALPLTLIAGLVLLGTAPFHFWTADVLQGAFPAVAPLAVLALQTAGGRGLSWRLEGVGVNPDAALQSGQVLEAVTAIGFLVGAGTLLVQRQPDRRVGTLAGLQGALLVAAMSAQLRLSGFAVSGGSEGIARWSVHLALALTGAAIAARFTPSTSAPGPAAVLYRRHPWSAAAGVYAQLSLAGAPGTPGSLVWFAVARDLMRSAPPWVVLALVGAWLAAFVSVVAHARAACGVRSTAPPSATPVPWNARAALWICALPLVSEFVRPFLPK